MILLTLLLHLLCLSSCVNSTHKDIFNNNDTGDYPTQWHKKREGLVVSGPESGGCKSKLEWFKCGNGNVEDQCKNSHQPKTHFYLTSVVGASVARESNVDPMKMGHSKKISL